MVFAAVVASAAACSGSPTGVVPIVLGGSTFDYPSVGIRPDGAGDEVERAAAVHPRTATGRGGHGFGSGN